METFKSLVRSEFLFLELEYGFTCVEQHSGNFHFNSEYLVVALSYGRHELEIAFSEVLTKTTQRGFWSRLLSPEPRPSNQKRSARSSPQTALESTFTLRDVIDAMAAVPLHEGHNIPDAVHVETAEAIETELKRMAALTRLYAGPLLRGEAQALRVVREHKIESIAARQRIMLLRDLPAEDARKLQDAPLEQVQRIRDDALKEKILARTGDEFASLRHLAGTEFLEEHRKLKLPKQFRSA